MRAIMRVINKLRRFAPTLRSMFLKERRKSEIRGDFDFRDQENSRVTPPPPDMVPDVLGEQICDQTLSPLFSAFFPSLPFRPALAALATVRRNAGG